jgi:molybdate transport system regulatory protein
MSGQWNVRSKIWIELDGEPIMGVGRVEILRAIDSSGSILQASRVAGIPYRRIWGALRDMERLLEFSLVRTKRGGSNGGGTSLTPRAKALLDRFDRLHCGIQEEVDARFKELFHDFFLRPDMQFPPNGQP